MMTNWKRYVTSLAAVVALTAGCATDPTDRGVGQVVDDATITARVKTALIREDDVKARNVNVTTYRGVVQLSGFVESQATADRAASEARRVPGVQRVENNLRVQPAR